MTNYSNILPATDHEAQALLSSCGPAGDGKPYDVASLVVDDGVRLSMRTRYGSGDGTPMDEWHQLVRRYELPGGVSARWLREGLAGGEIADLIDRILAGHHTAWDGRNYVGRLTADGMEADEALSFMMYDAPTDDLEVWGADGWLYSGQMSLQELAALLREETPEQALAQAESDGTLVIRGGIEAMRDAFAAIFAAADAEDAA